MKKIIMMAVAAFMATAANAQFEKGTWSLQPFLGGSISSITNVGSFDIDDGIELKKRTRVGYIIGGEAEYQFAKKFSVAAGINYTTQGCGWKDIDYFDGGAKIKIKDQSDILGYIKIPIVANYYIFKGFAVKAGVQFGFMVSSKFFAHGEADYDLFGDGVKRAVDLYGTVDMKDYAGKTVYLCFRHHDTQQQYLLRLDDVVISKNDILMDVHTNIEQGSYGRT